MQFLDKFLAAVCTICPLCILKRRFPDSAYSHFLETAGKWCPFCRAYGRKMNTNKDD